MKKTIWLIPLEYIETRYTAEWATKVPAMLYEYAREELKLDVMEMSIHNKYTMDNYSDYLDRTQSGVIPMCEILTIPGDMPSQVASAGAFINFASTNVWKSTQAARIAECFHRGLVKAGDVFYFTDAWNPVILQVRYMSDLLGIPVKIVGQWHAGWHDPNDFLGKKAGELWCSTTEAALFHAIDANLFTTNFYRDMFFERLDHLIQFEKSGYDVEKCPVQGYPHRYLADKLSAYRFNKKERIVLFPHRIAEEKRPDLFRQLEAEVKARPGYEDVQFIIAQETPLTKAEYHELLGRSKVVFSCAEQETYGIAQTEAVFAGAYPLMPNKLSYAEMYNDEFLYEPVDSDGNFNMKEAVSKCCKLLDADDTSYLWGDLAENRMFLLHQYVGDKQICEVIFGVGK